MPLSRMPCQLSRFFRTMRVPVCWHRRIRAMAQSSPHNPYNLVTVPGPAGLTRLGRPRGARGLNGISWVGTVSITAASR